MSTLCRHKNLNFPSRNYLPGKNGQTIGIIIKDTINDTTHNPVPAFT
jgi:hypothetical protein